MKKAIPVLAILCLSSVLVAQPIAVSGIAVDKLLEGVRVTIACSGSPNVSSFVSAEPPAIVIDLMGASSKLSRERIESSFYPVSAVTVQSSEATDGLRIIIRLRDMVEYEVTAENGLIVVDLGTDPIVLMKPAAARDPFAGKRLTLYVKDAEISDILRMISSQFDLNILMSQDVKQVITVRLSDVPLRVGLDAVLKAGLCNIVEAASGIMIVKPVKKEMYGETQTRVFDIDYCEAEDLQKVVNKSLSEVGSAEAAYRRVSKSGGDARNAALVVTDVPEALDRVARLVAEYDRPVPQIAIEAKFVETVVTGEDRYGIGWQIAASAGTGEFDWSKDFGLPIVFNNMVLGKINLGSFNAQLELLQSRGLSRVLASPRTVTMDNQTAKMKISTDIPQREVTTDANSGLVIYTWKTRSVPIGIEVTPHVTSDGKIVMSLSPEVEAITGYTGPADDQRPIVSRRAATTQVTVADGEVAVIGGLIQDNETRTVGKIPILGDIPILGHLFKKTSVTHTKTDLQIFIIPHILPVEG